MERERRLPRPVGQLAQRYKEVRARSEEIQAPLSDEDCAIQSMPDVSPTRWHLAHTAWFFETFVLAAANPERAPYHPRFEFLFNSYYNSVGDQYPRARRGLLSRPSRPEILDYRAAVDEEVLEFLELAHADRDADRLDLIELGLHHEQQHQELMLTDIKHVLWQNPLLPTYRPSAGRKDPPSPPEMSGDAAMHWLGFEGGLEQVGCAESGFAFDNERPAHRLWLEPFELAERPVSNRMILEFIEDGGYDDPMLWLSAGWEECRTSGSSAPLYWIEPKRSENGRWQEFTLSGSRPLNLDAPACHLSYFEADAVARWAGARLPTEAEWEVVARDCDTEGNLADSGRFHPTASGSRLGALEDDALSSTRESGKRPEQLFGDVWEWTQSPYVSYPGFAPAAGAVGEYNGKFMCNQIVLRGGSCATPPGHIRATYRNFFPPASRWQFSGLRLAR